MNKIKLTASIEIPMSEFNSETMAHLENHGWTLVNIEQADLIIGKPTLTKPAGSLTERVREVFRQNPNKEMRARDVADILKTDEPIAQALTAAMNTGDIVRVERGLYKFNQEKVEKIKVEKPKEIDGSRASMVREIFNSDPQRGWRVGEIIGILKTKYGVPESKKQLRRSLYPDMARLTNNGFLVRVEQGVYRKA